MKQATNASTFNFSELSSLEDTLYDAFAEMYVEATGDDSNYYEYGETAEKFVEACLKALNENVDIASYIREAQQEANQ